MTTTSTDAAREDVLGRVRSALNRTPGQRIVPVPPSARVAPRQGGDPASEMAMLLDELEKLTGITRRVHNQDELAAALAELVARESVTKATLWTTDEIKQLGIPETLSSLGVEIVPCSADRHQVGACELGVTGVDAALPETGTLLLRSAPDKPRMASLLPRVHLALLRASALRPDLRQAFADAKNDGGFVCITGPSRTADIELTLTLGVHGPKTLYVFVIEF
jgi:L-lactate dehydrogenase complex protein LldG